MPNLVRLDRSRRGGRSAALLEFLNKNVVGQERAVKGFSSALESYESGFHDFNSPICSFLFSGPSGVGKTLAAEILAKFLFGGTADLTKVACSDFQASHDISALIGAPAGYVGFHNPNDPNYSGMEPILSQWNIDKYDFLRQKRQSDNRAVVEAGEKLMKLEVKKQILVDTLLELANSFEAGAQRLANKANRLGRELQEEKLTDRALELADLLFHLAKKAKIKGKQPDLSRKEELKRQLEKLTREAQVAVETSVEDIQKLNPAVVQVVGKLMEVEMEIETLHKLLKQKGAGYDPRNGYLSVVLFDEMEKAHPALLNLLLEVMDKGRLTMKNGQVVSFANTFLIMTSNIGSTEISKLLSEGGIGFRSPVPEVSDKTDRAIYETVMKETKKTLPAFFRGRLDNIVVFRPLDRETLRKILELQLQEIYNELVRNNLMVKLNVQEEVKDFLVEKALANPEEGARVLKKRLRRYVVKELSQFKNSGEVRAGDIVHVNLEDQDGEKKVVLYREPRVGESS